MLYSVKIMRGKENQGCKYCLYQPFCLQREFFARYPSGKSIIYYSLFYQKGRSCIEIGIWNALLETLSKVVSKAVLIVSRTHFGRIFNMTFVPFGIVTMLAIDRT